MTEIVYGVWDGIVYDNRAGRSAADDRPVPPPTLANFDSFDDGNRIRAFFGDRGFFVFDRRRSSLIDALWRQMEEAAEQSCGKCTPCRMGTVLVRDALDALRRGEPARLGLDEHRDAGRADDGHLDVRPRPDLRRAAAGGAAPFPRRGRGARSSAARSRSSTASPT